MRRFLVSLVANAIALWLTTLLVSGVVLDPFQDDAAGVVLSYLFVALIFGLVNGFVGTLIRVVAFPLYILTLGLISLVINALLLMLAAWFSQLFGFGLVVDGFWWAVLGALVLAILSAVIGSILRPLSRSKRD